MCVRYCALSFLCISRSLGKVSSNGKELLRVSDLKRPCYSENESTDTPALDIERPNCTASCWSHSNLRDHDLADYLITQYR